MKDCNLLNQKQHLNYGKFLTMIYCLLRNFSDVAVNDAFVMTGNLKKKFFVWLLIFINC